MVVVDYLRMRGIWSGAKTCPCLCFWLIRFQVREIWRFDHAGEAKGCSVMTRRHTVRRNVLFEESEESGNRREIGREEEIDRGVAQGGVWTRSRPWRKSDEGLEEEGGGGKVVVCR